MYDYNIFEIINDFVYNIFDNLNNCGFGLEMTVYAPYIATIGALIFIATLIFAIYVLYKLLGGIFNVLR